MAPRKRTREDTVEEIVEVREASSSLRPQEARKRARISTEAPSKEPTPAQDDSSDSENNDEELADAPQSPPQTQYEAMRDNGFRHLDNPELDDMRATQAIARQTTKLGDNSVAESGIIQSITCYNFMCHTRLHVELGPLINFIVGENGSGKSAVLTALTLCLGGKASDTNRGGSLRSFVKEGQDHGSLVVKIKNGGSDAYQPEVYGDTIIVERHFSKTGASGFKIKSAMERTISTKKQEVEEISEWYALQIGNPLTVLSQDNARQFLNASTPAQKYKYFVSGVQLEQLDNDYKMSQDTLDKTLITRDELNETIEVFRKEMENAQRLAQTAGKNESLREKTRLYRQQLAWSQVVQQEKILEKRSEEVAERQRNITACERACEEKTEDLQRMDDKLEQVKDQRLSLDGEFDGFDERLSEAEKNYDAAKQKVSDLLHEERDAHGRLKNAKNEIKSLEEKIAQEETRLDESEGPQRAMKESELSAAREREKSYQDQDEETRQQIPSLQTKAKEAQDSHAKLQQSMQQKRKEVVAREKGIKELRESTGSPFDGYDREMRQLVDLVAKDSSFAQKPIGPLGAHIRLKKPEWSKILEKTFGEALNAFVVTSKADQTKLTHLIRQARLRRPPPIYIAYGGHIDTTAQEPDEEYETILKVLEFDSEIVKTQLVINYQIEKIILIKEREEAMKVMTDGNRAPRNVAACICFHDGRDKRGWGLRLTNRGGTSGSAPVRPSDERPRMQTDAGRQLALEEENLKLLGTELREVMKEERQAKQALERAERDIKDNQRQIKSLEDDIRRAQAEVEGIQEELDAFEGIDDRLVNLRSALDDKNREAEQIGGQYGTMSLAKRDLQEQANEAKGKLDEVKMERNDYESRKNKAEAKIKSVADLRLIAVSKKNEAYEKLDIERHEWQRAEERRSEQQERVSEFAGQASEMAPQRVHIPEGETFEGIQKKYRKLKEQLAQREQRLGATDQEIFDRSEKATQAYEDVMRRTQDVDDTISLLKRAIEDRLDRWRQFQRQISARIRIQFTYLLSERGFRGRIVIDHKNRRVNIQVEPDETKKSAVGRNTKTLSGGEKSFSSICMLLSVWEAIGSPIRCLDEFDVFMDNVNRAISTNMLVDAARRSVSRQYILITPNAIEGRARVDRDVKIIRLTDPRQRTLAF